MKIIRIDEVMDRTGKGRSTIYSDIAEGTFPRQVRLDSRSVGWIETEVDAWIQERMKDRDKLPRS